MVPACIYARTSTDRQDIDFQLGQLREFCAENGYEIVAEFSDRGISGAEGADRRTGLAGLLRALNCPNFNVIVVRERDRLARNVDIALTLDFQFKEAGVELVVMEDRHEYLQEHRRRLWRGLRELFVDAGLCESCLAKLDC